MSPPLPDDLPAAPAPLLPSPTGRTDPGLIALTAARRPDVASSLVAAGIETCSTKRPMTFNLADLFEAAVDSFGEREYLVAAGQRRTFAEMDARANRLAHYLSDQGVGPRDHVGHLLPQQRGVGRDGMGGVQAAGRVDQHQLPLRQRRAPLPLHQRRSGSPGSSGRVRAPGHRAAARAPGPPPGDHRRRRIRRTAGRGCHRLRGGHGGRESRAGLPAEVGRRPLRPLYRGHHRPPKGVVWRHEDVFYALGGGVDPITNTRVERPEEMVEKGRAVRSPCCPSPRSCTGPPSGRSWVRASRQPDHPGAQVRPPRGVEPGRERAGQLDHDHRRRHGQAAGRGTGRSRARPTTCLPCWPSRRPPPCSPPRSRTSSSSTSPTSSSSTPSDRPSRATTAWPPWARAHRHEERPHRHACSATPWCSTRTSSRWSPVRG